MPPKKIATPLPDALGHAITDKRLLILRSLSQAGSISQAARQAGVSYKAAWQAIDTLSNLSGVALVEKVVGGAGGGGARLTPAGVQLLDAAQKLGTVRKQLLADMAPAHAKNNMPPTPMALAVRTSMRNQLLAKVVTVKTVGALAWVRLQITEEVVWVAKITKESARHANHAFMQSHGGPYF